MNEEEKEKVLPLSFEFSYQFELPGDILGATNVVKRKILTGDGKFIHVTQYRYSHIYKDEIRKQMDELPSSEI